MADCFMKNIRKKTGRAKESILETFGKADRTTDGHFEDLNANFVSQHKSADKLYNQMKTYEMSMRVASQALRGFHDAIREIYEPEWGAGDNVRSLTRHNEMIWDEFLDKLHEESLVPVSVYAGQFVDVKSKIAKRGRKLVDYDGARHNLQTVQNSPKKTDEKVQKAQEQLTNAKQSYEGLNGELMTELPKLYEFRAPFIVNNLHSFYNLHANFLDETTKICNAIRDQIKFDTVKVASEIYGTDVGVNGVSKPSYDGVKKSYDLLNPPTKFEDAATTKLAENGSVKLLKYTPSPIFVDTRDSNMFEQNKIMTTPPPRPPSSPKLEPPPRLHDQNKSSPTSTPVFVHENKTPLTSTPLFVAEITTPRPTTPTPTSTPLFIQETVTVSRSVNEPAEFINAKKEFDPVQRISAHDGSLYLDANDNLKDETVVAKKIENEKVMSASYTILHKVRATHTYAAEDTDELSFEIGDIIAVIPYVEEDDVDEGWAMGVKEASGEKGVFPMNFTKNV